MTDFVELHLNPETLAELGLPDIGYPVPKDDFDFETGKLHLATLLYGLQWKSARPGVDWLALEPAMEQLALLMTPDDEEAVVTAGGDEWEVAIGGVDLSGEDRDRRVVTLQRGMHLIAAIRPLPSGQLRIAAYRPLDFRSAGHLINLTQLRHPEYGVQMRKNNWEFAMDLAAEEANALAASRGEVYLSFWAKGLGVSAEGVTVPAWREQGSFPSRRPASVAAELGAWYTLSASQ
ncbi:MAG TPA: hypothetical protein VFM34_03885 [Moraxellaceae bacterium]|nr:hypothetical protein [Moraxellaceae bacterium]